MALELHSRRHGAVGQILGALAPGRQRHGTLQTEAIQPALEQEIIGAMLDRLLHRSVVFNIDGDSYRMRAHRARAEHLRKGVVVRSGG